MVIEFLEYIIIVKNEKNEIFGTIFGQFLVNFGNPKTNLRKGRVRFLGIFQF